MSFDAVTYAAAVKKANAYTDSMINRGILVGQITNGGSFPTTRPDGSPLQDEDYVKPLASSTFPFTVGTVTFDNRFTTAIRFGGIWIASPGLLQDTAETPLKSPASEGMTGTEATQAQVNANIKTMKLDKATDTVSIEHAYIHKADGTQGLMQININANAGLAIVRRDIDKQINVPLVPLGDDDAASKKYVDESIPQVDNVTIELNGSDKLQVKDAGISLPKFATQATTDSGKVYAIKSDGTTELRYSNDVAKVDNVTIENDSTVGLRVKDDGITTAKIADAQVTLPKLATQATADARKVYAIKSDGTTELDYAENLVKVDNVTLENDATVGIRVKDDGITTAKVKDDQITLAKLATQATTEVGKVYSIASDGKTQLDTTNNLLKVDDVTIEDDATNGIQIKDAGVTTVKISDAQVTLPKLATQATTEERKVYSIKSDGTTELEYAENLVKVDNVTLENDATNGLQVKDAGIGLVKLATQAVADKGKAYTIKADGTTELTHIKQYKQVSTFVGEVGNTYTMYYLDTPDATHTVGVYVWDSVGGFTLVANTGGSSSSTFIGLVTNGDTFPVIRPDGTALVLGDYVKPAPTSTFPFTIGTVTFTSIRDTAVYMGSTNWVLNANPYQRTSEVLVNDSATESIGGIALYQNAINTENRTEILKRLEVVNVSVIAATSGNLGKLYCQQIDVVGPPEYKKGHIYVCALDGGSYVWKEVYEGSGFVAHLASTSATAFTEGNDKVYEKLTKGEDVAVSLAGVLYRLYRWDSGTTTGLWTVLKTGDNHSVSGYFLKVEFGSSGASITVTSAFDTAVLYGNVSTITASSTNEGVVYCQTADVVGPPDYTKGHFYICVNNSGTYEWTDVYKGTAQTVEAHETLAAGNTSASVTLPMGSTFISSFVLDTSGNEVFVDVVVTKATASATGTVEFTIDSAFTQDLTCNVLYSV